jgi:hypothetical protein
MPLDLLDPAATAAALGVTEGTLMVWRSTRRYPLNFVKIGGKVKYRRQDIEAFVQSRVVECGAESRPCRSRRRRVRKEAA